ncbi:MAG: hypothetical protein RL139_388 [Gemmatimonadota bacterium]
MVGYSYRINAYLTEVFPEMEPRETVTAVRSPDPVEVAVAALPPGRWVLAVSGGRDSMALLTAMHRTRAGEVAAVATFDHGTGPAAREACVLVREVGTAMGFPVRSATADLAQGTEAAWRAARYRFLRGVAQGERGQVVTAHTHDDQLETVVMRLLRGAGPRGLAGMRTGRDVVRPLLTVSRDDVARYAAAHQVPYVEDPSNSRLDAQRNRVRHELLPALERAVPGFCAWCGGLSRRAAQWRNEVDAVVETLSVSAPAPGVVVVPVAVLSSCDATAWSVLWPALMARAGIVLDRRGLVRAATWAPRSRPGQRIPLSGGGAVERTASTFIIRGTPGALYDYID